MTVKRHGLTWSDAHTPTNPLGGITHGHGRTHADALKDPRTSGGDRNLEIVNQRLTSILFHVTIVTHAAGFLPQTHTWVDDGVDAGSASLYCDAASCNREVTSNKPFLIIQQIRRETFVEKSNFENGHIESQTHQ